jgi:hypothetical protein
MRSRIVIAVSAAPIGTSTETPPPRGGGTTAVREAADPTAA